jgi:hypothetical protein
MRGTTGISSRERHLTSARRPSSLNDWGPAAAEEGVAVVESAGWEPAGPGDRAASQRASPQGQRPASDRLPAPQAVVVRAPSAVLRQV